MDLLPRRRKSLKLLYSIMNLKHNILALVGKANKNFKSRPSTYACESLRFACAMTLWETQIIYNVSQ